MNTKHTPAPWTAHGCTVYQNDQWQEGKNLGGKQVARAYPDPLESDSMPTEEDTANARLIAAAPELLYACELAYDELAKMGCECDCENIPTQCPVCACKAAIAKARGEA